MEWEFVMLQTIQSMRTSWLDQLMVFVTSLGDAGLLWIVLGVVFVCRKRTRAMGAAVLISLLLGHLVGNGIMKPLIARPRPCHVIPTVELLIQAPTSYSFPSGHTMSSFEGAVSIFLFNRRWGAAALVAAVLIAFSRMYLFVHFPTDVLVGFLFGVLHGWLVYKLVAWWRARKGCLTGDASK